MSKQVIFGKDAVNKLLTGLDVAANAVSGTLGPKGRNVLFKNTLGVYEITNDGVTVANQIELKDVEEDAGAFVIRNITGQSNDDVGDGTTTTAVLTQALIHESLERPENPMMIKQSLKQAGDKVLKLLAKQSIKLKKEDIEKVALVSSEDKHIAQLITEIIHKLGGKAVINVEDSKTFATDYEIVDGYEAAVGFMSPHFVTDRKQGKAIYSDIPVVVSERKISNIQDIKPIFEMFQKANINQAVFVVEDIDDSMLGVLVQNKLMGTFNSLVIRANGWLLSDIMGATGAQMISNHTGITFADFKPEHLGFASKVVCSPNNTLFTTDGKAAKLYANILQAEADNDLNQFSSKQIVKRVVKLRGGMASLRIGAPTDFERDYLRRKAEDSVKAVQAALAEGVVEGGGMALWRIANAMTPKTIGEEILQRAMQVPLRTIINNAGKDYTKIVGMITTSKQFGYDAKNDKIVDLIKAGIIDPAKVERVALENAVSAASTFITTFALITPAKEDK